MSADTPSRHAVAATVRTALVDGDLVVAEDVARTALHEGMLLHDLYDALTELLYEVGDGWECGDVSIAEEHRITAAVEALVTKLRGAPPPVTRGTVVLAAPEGERHVTGLHLLSHLLEYDGFRVVNGGELPWREIGALAEKHHDGLVAVGLTRHRADRETWLRHGIDKLRDHLDGTPVVLGGLAFARAGDGRRFGADAVVTTARDGVELLHRLSGPLTPREIEVLQAVSDGLDNNAAADRLGVRPSTVKAHLDQVFAKLGVSTRAAAVATALRRRLIR